MEAALDPFHDYQIEHVAGLPDLYSAPSVTQMVTRNLTITKPVTAPAGNWQCSVLYTGLTGQLIGMRSSPSQFYLNYDHTTYASSGVVGPLTVMAGGSADEMTPVLSVGGLSDQAVASDAPSRVLAVGVEVHNTTSSMYRQGSMTVGILQPYAPDFGDVVMTDIAGATPYASRNFQSDNLSEIPVSEAQLRLVPSSRTWEASKGVYMVPRMIDSPKSRAQWGERNSLMGFQATGNRYYHTQPYTSIVGYTPLTPVLQGANLSGFTPMMSLFTGLSDQTTLTVTFKTLVEIFPQPSSPLGPLATPSCPADFNAISAYSAISAAAPYAVPVGENSAGDFFRKVIAAAKWAAPALGLLPGGVGKVLMPFAGPAIGMAERLLDVIEPRGGNGGGGGGRQRQRNRQGGNVPQQLAQYARDRNAAGRGGRRNGRRRDNRQAASYGGTAQSGGSVPAMYNNPAAWV